MNYFEISVDDDQLCGTDQPDADNDIIVSSNGYKLSVSASGQHIGEFEEDADAYRAVRKWMKQNNWFPSIWFVSDHGNTWQVDDKGNEI